VTCTMGGMPFASLLERTPVSSRAKSIPSLAGVQSEVTSVAVIHFAASHCTHMRHSGYVTETLVRLFSTTKPGILVTSMPWCSVSFD
jgi:hypothetical protein